MKRFKKPRRLSSENWNPWFELLDDRCLPSGFVMLGPTKGQQSGVQLMGDGDGNGTYETQANVFFPFGEAATTSIKAVGGNFDGDFDLTTDDEIAVSTRVNGVPTIKLYAMTGEGRSGNEQDAAAPLGESPTAFFLAAGDIDGDGQDELIVSTGKSVDAELVIVSDLDRDGRLSDETARDSFAPFPAGFQNGVRVAAADLTGDGRAEIIVVGGRESEPRVRIFRDADNDGLLSDDPLFDEFLAFDSSFLGGLNITAGALPGVGPDTAEIIVGQGGGGSGLVRVFSDLNNNGLLSDDAFFEEVAPFADYTGGVRLAIGDTDADPNQDLEIIAAQTGGFESLVTILDDNDDQGFFIGDNPADDEFAAFSAGDGRGVFPAFAEAIRERITYGGDVFDLDDQESRSFELVVPAEAGIIQNINVGVNMAHSDVGDLELELFHVPSGRSLVLMDNTNDDVNDLYVVFDDEADDDIAEAPGVSPAKGRYQPQGDNTLTVFNGVDASGLWVLDVRDTRFLNSGSFLTFSLEIYYDRGRV